MINYMTLVYFNCANDQTNCLDGFKKSTKRVWLVVVKKSKWFD